MENMKKQMLKPALSLFLALVMLVTVFPHMPVTARAAGEVPVPPSNMRINLMRETYNVLIDRDPYFSWTFRAEGFDQMQTGYRVEIVKSSTTLLDNGVYDSGWVVDPAVRSHAGLYVPKDNFSYNTLYYWRVNTRDKNGAESGWSAWVPFVTEIGNTWAYYVEGQTNPPGIWGPIPGAAPAAPTFGNITMEIDLTITAGNALGVAFRSGGTSNTQMYMWQFRTNGTTDNGNSLAPHRGHNNAAISANNAWRVHFDNAVFYENEAGKQFPEGKKITLENNKSFLAKIKVAGNSVSTTITTWIDMKDGDGYFKVSELTFTDSASTLNTGRFGFRTGGTEGGFVEYMRVINDTTGEIIFESDFTVPFPNPLPGASIANGRLSVPSGQGNGIYYNPSAATTRRNNFLFMRSPVFHIADVSNIEKAVISGAAYMNENGTNANSDSLSYIYDLFINGESVGVGPARLRKNYMSGNGTGGHRFYYNTFDVTDLLKSGGNVVAATCYSRGNATSGSGAAQRRNSAVLFEMTVFYKDGTKQVLVNSGRDAADWRVKDGTAAFGDARDISTNGYIRQSQEDMNGLAYPFGWNKVDFDMANDPTLFEWVAPAVKNNILTGAANGSTLGPFMAENILRFDMPAESVDTIVGTTGTRFQVVDLGKEIVGGLKFTYNNPGPAFVLRVQYGESLVKPWDPATGENTNFHPANAPYWTVRFSGWRDNPVYNEVWIIRPGMNELSTTQMKNFRWVQFVDAPINITKEMVTGLATRQAFDYDAAYMISDDSDFFNDVVELCKYSILATNQDQFTDSYSRERRAYEGDQILNQYSSYAVIDNYALGRHSNEYLFDWPTWPPEYRLFSIEMAWADYLWTGDKSSLEKHYELLDGKLPTRRNGSMGTYNNSGFVAANDDFGNPINLCRDISGAQSGGALVDWPATEQNDYRRSGASNLRGALTGTGVNGSFTTVYNSVAYGVYSDMAKIAKVLGHDGHAVIYQNYADMIKTSLIEKLYNPATGAFHDSYSRSGRSANTAQHATAYALAYGIFTDQDMADKMVDFLRTFDGPAPDGFLRSSVYGTYFVLRGLYNANAGDLATRVMLEENPDIIRSWAHMLYRQQATITTEAWSPWHKDNMTYSHPWGSTPGTLITQGVFGIKPLEPGFDLFEVKFQPSAALNDVRIKSPTVKGPVYASFIKDAAGFLTGASVTVPANSRARIYIPVYKEVDLIVNGTKAADAVYVRDGSYMMVERGSGEYQFTVSVPQLANPQIITNINTNSPFGDNKVAYGLLAEEYDLAGASIDASIVAEINGEAATIEVPRSSISVTATNCTVEFAEGKYSVRYNGNSKGSVVFSIALPGNPVITKTVDLEFYESVLDSLDIAVGSPYFLGESEPMAFYGRSNDGARLNLSGFSDVKWESSDPEVATADNGVLTITLDSESIEARARTTASISAHLESNPSIRDTKEITVINDAFSLTNPYFKKIPLAPPGTSTLGTNVYGRRVSQWEQAANRGPHVVFDGSTSVDYDGQADSWAAMKADYKYTPAYARWWPRNDRPGWMVGAWFQGSNVLPTQVEVSHSDPRSWVFDQDDWTTLQVIKTSVSGWNGTYLRGHGPFEYLGVFSGDTQSCQVNEVEFYYYYDDSELSALYEKLKDEKEEDYGAGDWGAFTAALEAARVELEKPIAQASQRTTDFALAALKNAHAEIASSNATLSALTVSAGTLYPDFAPDIKEYRINVTEDIESVTITATSAHGRATVSGDGVKTNFVPGENAFDITVTAQDFITTETYTIVVIYAICLIEGCDFALSEEVDAACEEDGYELWVCRNDEKHTELITLEATGHDLVLVTDINGKGAVICQNKCDYYELAEYAEVNDAFVTKLTGNRNDLTITIIETFASGFTNWITRTLSINNNAEGIDFVGGYRVYFDTKGNDQIRKIYIVE